MDRAPQRKLHETALLIERLIAVFLFIALLVGVALVLRPFTTAILFGGIIVIATWPVHDWFLCKGFSPASTASVLLAISLILIVVPILIMAPRLGAHLTALVNQIQTFFENAPDLPAWIVQLPVVGARIERLWLQVVHGQFHDLISPYSEYLRKTAFDFGSGLAQALLQLILSLALATMFWLRGDVIGNALQIMVQRFAGPFGGKILLEAAASVRGVAYGIVGTALAQAIALTAGLFMAGVPNAGVLGFLALLIALSQIGVLLIFIWGGAAWWLYVTGAQWAAIFIIIWGLFVSLVDNILRPMLVGFGTPMPLILVFLGVLGGFLAFGFLGLFIGPTLLAILYALLQAWRLPGKSY